MKLSRKTIWRLFVLAAILVLAAGFILPRINASRFGNRVRVSLEQALGRKVELGQVHLDLFNGPGFSVDQVIIHDDPRIGIEPFAYVESLEARVSFASFWTGRLVFSKLRLVNPRVNLTRPRSGPWNFEELLTRTAGAAPAGVRLPVIQVRDGRINFKFEDTKSIFYFTDALLDATPPSSPGGAWRLRFEGQPARTDRPALGFGAFTARGTWRPDPSTGGNLNLTLGLEQGSLAELIRLVRGYDIGIHGEVTSQARLTGPVNDVKVSGHLEIGGIHRWDLVSPDTDNWPLDYRGQLDLISQTLVIETVPPAGAGPLPLSFRVRATGYLSHPVWAVLITFDRSPLAPLPEVGRHMGLTLPRVLALDGDLTGVLGYSSGVGLKGKLVARGAEIRMPDSPAIRLERAELIFEDSRVSLSPTALHLPAASRADQATLEGAYSWTDQTLDTAITTRSMAIPEPGSSWARLLGPVPLMRECRHGRWRGLITYHQQGEAPGGWAGTILVENTQIPLSGFADPLELDKARIIIRDGGGAVDRISGHIGEADLAGEYHYRPRSSHPHQFRISVNELNATELERLLLPALQRDDSFLARALRLGRARVPEWLAARHAEGVLEVQSFLLGGQRFHDAHARLRWDGVSIEATELSSRWGGGLLDGSLSASLRHALPVYHLSGGFESVNWMGARWNGKGTIETSGVGVDLLRNFSLNGAFKGASPLRAAGAEFRSVSGTCTLSIPNGLPQLRFTGLRALVGGELYRGQGATGPDGRLAFELSSGQKPLRLTGTLFPFQLGPG
jgi:hypothetical protein